MFGFGRRRRPLDEIEKAGLDVWLNALGLVPKSAHYNLYRDVPLTETELTVCVVGVADVPVSPPSGRGHSRGFCVELYQGRAYEGILMEPRIAVNDKDLARQCKVHGARMIEAFRHIAPHENWFSSSDPEPEVVPFVARATKAAQPAQFPEPAPETSAVPMFAEESLLTWGRTFALSVLALRDRGEVSASEANFRLATEYLRFVEASFERYDEGELTTEEMAGVLVGRGGYMR